MMATRTAIIGETAEGTCKASQLSPDAHDPIAENSSHAFDDTNAGTFRESGDNRDLLIRV